MVYYLYVGFLLCLAVYTTMNGCPTCIGKIEKQSPPFFSKEFDAQYRWNKQKNQRQQDQKLQPSPKKVAMEYHENT